MAQALERTRPAYSEAQKEYVYQVWCYQADRKSERVASILAIDPDAVELGINAVSGRTIREWASSDDWASRAGRDLYGVAPHLRHNAQSTLALASPEAAVRLRYILNLPAEVTRMVRKKDGSPVLDDATGAPLYETYIDVNILKLQVTTGLGLLDRTGFSPIGVREGLGAMDPPPSSIDAAKQHVDTMDVDTLKEHERYIREKLGIGRGQ